MVWDLTVGGVGRDGVGRGSVGKLVLSSCGSCFGEPRGKKTWRRRHLKIPLEVTCGERKLSIRTASN